MKYLRVCLLIQLYVYVLLSINQTHGYFKCTKTSSFCEIRSEEDERTLLCPDGMASCQVPVTRCPDGSLQKTCVRSQSTHSVSFLCKCGSIANDFEFSQSGFSISTKQPYTYIKKIYLKSTSGDFEYSVRAIVAAYDLSDDVYSASSVYSPKHAAHRARIDKYFDYSCSWSSGSGNAWLQISLPTVYRVEGIVIKKRCDTSQYPTRITIRHSNDGEHWQDVMVSVTPVYSGSTAYMWFTTSFDSRYWRVYVLSFVAHASMQLDVIGG